MAEDTAKPHDKLEAIADRCTPEALAVLHKIQDKDILSVIIEALKATDGVISDGTIFVTLIQLKDELEKNPTQLRDRPQL